MPRPPASPEPPFHQYSRFLADRYGEQLHRIPIDFGFGCPNRAPDGTGGCAFCAEDGARARQTLQADTVEEQVAAGIDFARRRYKARHFMAYIQAFTGTFAPTAVQTALYRKLLGMAEFRALSVGTRPDCLDEATLAFLTELAEELDVWVELGVQTVHDATLNRLERGHDWETSRRAILLLKERGLNVAVHVILGLPGESDEHIRQTADALASLPIDGIKIHNLHVVRGTRLAAELAHTPFAVWNEHEYADVLIGFLRRLPPDLPIMRVQTDTPDEALVAPRWAMDKGQFLTMLTSQMLFRDVRQGDLRNPHASPPLPPDWPPVTGDDGSITFWSPEFREHYHPPAGARTTARVHFIEPCDLRNRLRACDVRILDVGFGLGYNTLAACNVAAEYPSGHKLSVTALDLDRRAALASSRAMVAEESDRFGHAAALETIYREGRLLTDSFSVRALWGDARHTVRQLRDAPAFDVVFVDPFSTQRNAELWTVDFLRSIRQAMDSRGILVTRCTATPVRAGLIEAGFSVGTSPGTAHTRGSTVAAIRPEDLPQALSEAQATALNHPIRRIPYRDPTGTATNRDILTDWERRRAERVASSADAPVGPGCRLVTP